MYKSKTYIFILFGSDIGAQEMIRGLSEHSESNHGVLRELKELVKSTQKTFRDQSER